MILSSPHNEVSLRNHSFVNLANVVGLKIRPTFQWSWSRWRYSLFCRHWCCWGCRLFSRPDCLEALFCSGGIRAETNPKIIPSGCYGGWSTCATKLSNHRALRRQTIPYLDVIILANCIVFKCKRLKRKHYFISRLDLYYPCAYFIHRVMKRKVWCLDTPTFPLLKPATVIWNLNRRWILNSDR